MTGNDCPKLRPLRGRELIHDGRNFVVLECPFGLFSEPIAIAREWFDRVVRHFDGSNSLLTIQARVFRETSQLIPLDDLTGLANQLDRALALESPALDRFLANYRKQRIRPAAHAGGAYAGTERALRSQLASYFASPEGSGLPQALPHGIDDPARPKLRGILSPHIDFGRGGTTYTWAYKELIERTDADVFVIFGVAHSPCRQRFTLTRKDFETPLGLVRTDQDFVDLLAERVGPSLFEDELAHRREHSVEFQVVFLQYLLGTDRDFSIVPILTGSFHDLLQRRVDPISDPAVARFVGAVREAEATLGKRVAYIGGIDLCHVGPEFGDREPVADATLEEVRRFDSALLDRAGAVDPAGWFGTAAETGDRWRVCGLSATYAMMHAMGPAQGRLLRYNQAINSPRTCCVTFASLAFDAIDGPASREGVALLVNENQTRA
jgi:MEMO1 family protein